MMQIRVGFEKRIKKLVDAIQRPFVTFEMAESIMQHCRDFEKKR